MATASFDALDDEIEAREAEAEAVREADAAQDAADAELRRNLVCGVQGLQLALNQINSKIAATRKENSDLATENDGLTTYIDSLMANINAMGSKIVTDKPTSPAGGILRRLSTARKSLKR